MKKIGISYTTTNFPFYWNWFTPDDLEFITLVRLSFEDGNVKDIETCDGFILTGGIDIEPGLYGGTEDYPNAPDQYQTERDRFEEQIYRHAMKHSIPVLGICRGLQLVNVLEGGGLVQDLGKENKQHKKEEVDKEHEIAVVKNSLLFDITRQAVGRVNSAHHQGIVEDVLSDVFMPNAYSFDEEKYIEGFEFREKDGRPFLLCVQWHPERMKDKDENPFSKGIKEKFIAEVKKKE